MDLGAGEILLLAGAGLLAGAVNAARRSRSRSSCEHQRTTRVS
jgi:hypothetical protein